MLTEARTSEDPRFRAGQDRDAGSPTHIGYKRSKPSELERDITKTGQAVGNGELHVPRASAGEGLWTRRTDIFSLGVVLYELATGRQAFPGSTIAAVFDAVLNKPPVAPVSVNRKLPPGLEQIINKALEKDRDLRYQSAAEIARDLKRLQKDPSLQVAGATTFQPKLKARWIGIAAVIALLAVAAYLKFGDRSISVGPLTTRQLTSYSVVEWGGTWSPDGNYFAYGRSAFGPMDIFVESLAGGDPVHLVESPADDLDPRWSPDNKWIAFASNREGTYGIYLIPPLGGDIRKLVDTGMTGLIVGAYYGSSPWSQDAQEFLFTRRDSTTLGTIWKIDIKTGVETQLTFASEEYWDLEASWSWDGSNIVFTRFVGGKSRADLMMMSPDGEGSREVLADGNINSHASWSPDSKSLVFGSDAGGNTGVWMLRLGSKDPIQLTSVTGSAIWTINPTVSLNGQVLYNTFRHRQDLYLRNFESGEERRLTAHTGDNFHGGLSPDGKKVVYESTRTGNWEIFTLDLESGDERQLTDHQDPDRWASWSPDGQQIVFASTRPVSEGQDSGLQHLWVVPAEGGIPQLLHDKAVTGSVHWSPTGSLIGFVSQGVGGRALWVLDVGTGSVRKVLDHVQEFGWYRDEGRVLIIKQEPEKRQEMWAVDLGTGESRVLLNEPHLELRVAPDGSAVSYCSILSHFNMNLYVLKLTEGADGLPRPVGEPEQITNGRGEWHIHNGGWSRDGNRMVHTRDTLEGNLYLVEGVFEDED